MGEHRQLNLAGGEECHEERRDCRVVREVLLSETWIPLGQSNVGAGKSTWFREGGGRESMREE